MCVVCFLQMSTTLTYFKLPARAFVARICLRKAGVAFTDRRLEFPEWGALKQTGFGPLGQLPVLEVEGVQYCQSIPISKYAATLAGLYPAAPLAALQADEVVAIVDVREWRPHLPVPLNGARTCPSLSPP